MAIIYNEQHSLSKHHNAVTPSVKESPTSGVVMAKCCKWSRTTSF